MEWLFQRNLSLRYLSDIDLEGTHSLDSITCYSSLGTVSTGLHQQEIPLTASLKGEAMP